MRLKLSLCAAVCYALSAGCALVKNVTRNAIFEVARTVDNQLACVRNHRLANSAWDDVSRAGPAHQYSADYARGFKDGFADYLDAGGTGAPPPTPPWHYWTVAYQTPQGHQAVEEWYAGFWHGANAAREYSYRRWVMIPSSLPPPEATRHDPSAIGEPGPPPVRELLHFPQMVLPAAGDEPEDRDVRPSEQLPAPPR